MNGIMLPHYLPLRITEQFRVLEAMAPGRIDLGLGRTPGTDRKTAFESKPSVYKVAYNFSNNIQNLISWVSGTSINNEYLAMILRRI